MNRPGIFRGKIIEMVLGATKSGLAQVCIRAEFDAELQGDDYVQWEGGVTVVETGYFMLEKSDHSLNTFGIDSLHNALGWDRTNFDALDNGAFHGVEIQGTFRESRDAQYPGIKWDFINAPGDRPTLKRLEAGQRSAVLNRLSGKARAQFGGTQMNAPRPQTARPTAPPPRNGNGQTTATFRTTGPRQATAPRPSPARPPAPARQTAAAVAEITKDEAWEQFWAKASQLDSVKDRPDLEQFLSTEWNRICEQNLNIQPDADFTPEQCLWMAEHGYEGVIPF